MSKTFLPFGVDPLVSSRFAGDDKMSATDMGVSRLAAHGFEGGGNASAAEWVRARQDSMSEATIHQDVAMIGSRFGANFADVEIDAAAPVGIAEGLGAAAWTADREVHFRPGEYVPGTREGQRLLAHELAHVMQQDGRTPPPGWRKADPVEVQKNLDTAAELLSQAILAIDDGRLDALEGEAPVPPEQARGHLEGALTKLRCLRDPAQAGQAAELSFLLLQAGEHPDAASAGTTAEAFQDVDEGGSDSLEQEASRAADHALSGVGPVHVGRAADTPGVQRMALVIPVAIAIEELLIALGILALIVVAPKPKPLTVPFPQTNPVESTKTKDKAKDKTKDVTISKTDEKRDMGAMRFQVQWNTQKGGGGAYFGDTAYAQSTIGVTTAQAISTLSAVHASVAPATAQQASVPALQKAISWISERPAQGGIAGSFNKAFYFSYQNYTDARVDVQNFKGHNLKI